MHLSVENFHPGIFSYNYFLLLINPTIVFHDIVCCVASFIVRQFYSAMLNPYGVLNILFRFYLPPINRGLPTFSPSGALSFPAKPRNIDSSEPPFSFFVFHFLFFI